MFRRDLAPGADGPLRIRIDQQRGQAALEGRHPQADRRRALPDAALLAH
jgi:hypothetical protein